MRNIGIIAAAAGAIALCLAVSPATARSCAEDNGSCKAAENAPMKLDQFMKTWKPVAGKKRVKKSKVVRKRGKRPAEPQMVKTFPPETKPAPAVQTAPAPTLAAGGLAPGMLAAAPEDKQHTDGVAVTAADEVNELDAQADSVQVVAFNEVNDLDLAAPPAPVPPARETVGQAVTSQETPADNSWIGKLLLAVAGTIALAGTARFLIA